MKCVVRDLQKAEAVVRGCSINFTKFTGKHLCQRLFFNKVAATLLKNGLWNRCFPVKFCEISKNTFFYRTPLVAASEKEIPN